MAIYSQLMALTLSDDQIDIINGSTILLSPTALNKFYLFMRIAV